MIPVHWPKAVSLLALVTPAYTNRCPLPHSMQVTARANEILDERSMLRRYQKEVVDLKRQLAEARRLLAAAGINYQPSLTSCGGGEAAAAATPSGKAGGNAGGEAVASVEAVAAAAGVAVMVPGLGLLPLDAVAAAVENERSQRQTAELEATMLRLKAERLQVRFRTVKTSKANFA